MALRSPPEERSARELLSFGVLNLDKPPGPSAHQVVAWLRDMAGVERAAHAGTLDPKVTGCLPVLLGDATRMARIFDDAAKEYVAVLELHDRAPSTLDPVCAEFEGPIYQKPPRKSAVVRQLRVREIYDVTVLEVEDRRALLRVRCESGTYIRKLCHDLGLALGTGAHMGDLRRVATEPFDDRDLVTMHDIADALAVLEADGNDEWLRDVVKPAEHALEHLPTLTIASSAAEEVANGAPVFAPGVLDIDSQGREMMASETPADSDNLVVCTTPDGSAVCLGHLVGDPDATSGTVVELVRVLV